MQTHNSPHPLFSEVSRVLDSIDIASICALLVVSSAPEIIHTPQKLLPTLAGFVALGLVFLRSKSIALSALIGTVAYGLVFKATLFVT